MKLIIEYRGRKDRIADQKALRAFANIASNLEEGEVTIDIKGGPKIKNG
ncbi:MAG: hypothetical protein R3F11_02320 [Verrucomicrobiales bacterium]